MKSGLKMMMKARGNPTAKVLAHDHDGDLRLQTNLGKLDPCDLPSVFGALGAHLGLDPEPLRKAVTPKGGKDPDPRFPEVEELIRAARRDWDRWGDDLVRALETLLNEGKLLPMTDKNEQLLMELFRDHTEALTIKMTGHAPDRANLKRLIKKGLVSKDATSRSYIDVAWKVGRGLEALEPARKAPRRELGKVVRDALKYEMTPHDKDAIAYVKRRGAIHMRKPAQAAASEAARILNEEEYRKVRGALEEGIERQWSTKRVTQALNDAVKGHGSMTNDMERVARTELAYAHSHGAYQALKQQAEAAGQHDPFVYKFVSPGACSDCKRIWGNPGNPKKYRLSVVEARDAAGGNFKLNRREWGPVIGPVHPHCFPAGALVLTTRGEVPIESVNVGDRVLTHRGRWRRVTKTMSRHSDMVKLDGIPVSPEHPFLTLDGWKMAGNIKPGDHLIEPTKIRLPHSVSDPAKLSKSRFLLGVLAQLWLIPVPMSAIDFDPNLEGGYGEVYEVAIDLVSRMDLDASIQERIHKALLQLRLDGTGLRGDGFADGLVGPGGTSDGIVGGGGVSLPLGIGHVGVPDSGRLASAPAEPSFTQPLAESCPVDTKLISDSRGTLSRIKSFLDRIQVYYSGSPVVGFSSIDTGFIKSLVDNGIGAPESLRNSRGAHALVDVHSSDLFRRKRESLTTRHLLPHRIVEMDHYHTSYRSGMVYNLAVAGDESYVVEGRVVHNCTEGPIQYFHPELIDLINEAAEEFKGLF